MKIFRSGSTQPKVLEAVSKIAVIRDNRLFVMLFKSAAVSTVKLIYIPINKRIRNSHKTT